MKESRENAAVFTVDNITFRKPHLNDVDDLLVVKNNVKAAFLLGGTHHLYTKEDILRWIDFHNKKEDEVVLVMVANDANRVIGHVGLYKIDEVAKKTEYGILIADDNSRGKGYGTKATRAMVDYAFNTLGMHKVTAEVLNENIPSISMFTKCGFRIDGCLKDDVFKNGRYYDVLCMSVIRKACSE